MPVELLLLCGIILLFGVVQLFGPPYVPTLAHQKEVAFQLLDLKKGQIFLELGSGDGRMLLEAAKRGHRAVGVELNPLLVIVSLIVTYKYRKSVKIIWGNIWTSPWPDADGIFAFLLPKYMVALDVQIEKRHTRPVKLVSNAFNIKNKTPLASKDGVLLYLYN